MPKGQEALARAFYEGILGIQEVEKPGELAARGGVWFEEGLLKIHLGVEDEFRPAKKAHPALLVSDIEELLAALRAKGYSVFNDSGISGLRRAFSHDPFGNRIEFVQSEPEKIKI